MALTSAAPALAVCDPASTDPSCPIGQLSLSNPANPASPLNMNNPANPASPLNPNNPASPQYQWMHSPNNPASLEYSPPAANPYYGRPTVFDPGGFFFGTGEPEQAGYPADAGPAESDAPPPHRHHRHRRHRASSR